MNDSALAIRAYLGHRLRSSTGQVLGHIDDLLADARSGTPQWVVVRVRGPLPRHRAVPLALLIETAHGLVAPISRETLRSSPRVRLGADMTARQELAIHRYWTWH